MALPTGPPSDLPPGGTSTSSATNPYAEYVPLAERACEFLTASPDPFHVIHNCAKKLEGAGYARLAASEPFAGKLRPGGRYYYAVENTTLVAFAVGGRVDAGRPFGFHIIGGHTDSPNLKVKPRSKRSASGCTMLGVETYGGGCVPCGRPCRNIIVVFISHRPFHPLHNQRTCCL